MKRVGALFARAFLIALALLSLAGNIASADPGKHNPPPAPVINTAVLPEDPGFPELQSLLPDDPGYLP